MDWTLEHKNYDFIHARDLLLSIRDWPRLVGQAYEHIQPGGYLELQSVYPKIHCDDGTTPLDSGLVTFANHAREASRIMGTPLDACIHYASYMRAAGFENVTEVRVKMPSSPWPKETRLKLIGAFEMHNMLRGISGMSLRMFAKAYGWTQEQTELFLVQVRKDTANLRFHSYWDFIIVYGRKPGGHTKISESKSAQALAGEADGAETSDAAQGPTQTPARNQAHIQVKPPQGSENSRAN
jgi:hypothetical protein